MKTKYDIGDNVAVLGKVRQIRIQANGEIVYCIDIYAGQNTLYAEVNEGRVIPTDKLTEEIAKYIGRV